MRLYNRLYETSFLVDSYIFVPGRGYKPVKKSGVYNRCRNMHKYGDVFWRVNLKKCRVPPNGRLVR